METFHERNIGTSKNLQMVTTTITKQSPRSYPIQCERKWKYSFLSVDRKTTTDRLIAVRETGVSRHQGGPIEHPPETPRTSQHYQIEGIKGVPDSFLSIYSV